MYGRLELIYDGIDLADDFNIVSIDMPFTPQLTSNTVTTAGRAGDKFISQEIGTRVIKVKLRAEVNTRSPLEAYERMSELLQYVIKDKPCKLELSANRYVYAIAEGTPEVSQQGTAATVDINFVCHDPFIYGLDRIVYIDKHPDWARRNSGQIFYTFNYQGTAPTPAKLSFAQSGTSSTAEYKLTNSAGTKSAKFTTSSGSAAAYEFIIDGVNREFIARDMSDELEASLPVAIDSQFPVLMPGDNIFEFVAPAETFTPSQPSGSTPTDSTTGTYIEILNFLGTQTIPAPFNIVLEYTERYL